MDTYNVEQAANLLHLNPKRVQNLARSGRLPAVRIGRKWLFPRADLDALLSPGSRGVNENRPIELSARNQLRGRIISLKLDGVMAEVRIDLGGQELVAIITRGSAERMELKPGAEIFAVIKSTEVMVGR
jgi:molybdopterin-binding protein